MIGEKTQALRLDLTQNREVQRSDEKTNQHRQNRETDKKRITDREDSRENWVQDFVVSTSEENSSSAWCMTVVFIIATARSREDKDQEQKP